MGSPNRWRFRFQAVRLIVDNDTILIPTTISSCRSQFWSNFNLFLIKVDHFWLKYRSMSIKRSKESVNGSKLLIKRLKKSIYFDFFYCLWSILISFQLKSINFNLLNIIRTCFNRFRRSKLKSGFKFGSKKSIKSWFDHGISWLVDLDR